MKRKEHPDSDDDEDGSSSSQAAEKKRKTDLVRHGLASMFRKQTNCVPLPEYKQVRKQLSAKFQNRGMGSAWMSILDEFCRYIPAESVMVFGRKFIRQMTGNPASDWPLWAYMGFRALAIKIAKNQPLIMLRGVHARRQGLTTTILAFVHAFAAVFLDTPACTYVTAAPSEAIFFETVERTIQSSISDPRGPHKPRLWSIEYLERRNDKAGLPNYNPEGLVFVDAGVHGHDELIVARFKHVGLMGYPGIIPSHVPEPINHMEIL